jgi:hypothetical protein
MFEPKETKPFTLCLLMVVLAFSHHGNIFCAVVCPGLFASCWWKTCCFVTLFGVCWSASFRACALLISCDLITAGHASGALPVQKLLVL